ncbi:MAG TPA: DUF4136 domain-containing protein [Vicinamibacteria bacterium]|nr:DUF4136 domain-containing protein [Vicinamibacteria bacterium]
MQIRTLAVAAALSLVGAAASAQDVKVDFDKAADFSKFKTFAIKLGTSWNNPLSEKRVLAEIQQGLAEKGWTPTTDDAKADAIVVLHGATEKQKSLNTFYSGGYGGYGWRGGWGGGMGTSTTTVDEYTVGTLVVDIFDAKSKQLVYRGTASDELSNKPEKNAKKLAKASDKLFKDFPPGSAKK